MAMGLWMYRLRPGRIAPATVAGVLAMVACVVLGRWIPQTPLGAVFTLSKTQITLAMAAYGFVASVLPVWLLLAPRDYLSTYMKLGTIAFLALGVCLVNPILKMPAVTQFAAGGGPIVPGPLFPFLFITIACGAISGFHSLIGSGTTPKMLDRESDARVIGFGAMLCEGVVGVMALIAATSLHPADYFAINVTPEKFAALGLMPVNLAELQAEVGEALAGRTGGAVSLAVGMAQIFSGIPGMRGLMGYWYHFAIMFEALFILTTIDAGTRVARFILQEVAGRVHKPLGRTDWLPGTAAASLLVCAGWTYFILTGSISTIWPMFGIANQLLAGVALTIGTTILINSGRARYVWVTAVPLVGVTAITQTAGFLSIRDNYLPMLASAEPGKAFQGGLNATLTAIMMTCMALVLVEAGVRWWQVLSGRRSVVPDVAVTGGAPVRPAPGPPAACC
jgi:carbon starvation protein